MLVLEYKVKPKPHQAESINEAIRTVQFVRNQVLRYWRDNRGIGKTELFRYHTRLRKEFKLVNDFNSHACQAAIERVLRAINKFYENCQKQVRGKKGYPKFVRCSKLSANEWRLSS